MIKPNKWTRKKPCPHCGVSSGSRHNQFCAIAHKAIGKMKGADDRDIYCNLCGERLEYILFKNSHIWVCGVCPFIAFEYYGLED